MGPPGDQRVRIAPSSLQGHGLLAGFAAALLLFCTWLLYAEARKSGSGEPAADLALPLGLAFFFSLPLLSAVALDLRHSLFDAPELDAWLASPLTETELFWRILRRSRRLPLAAGGVCGLLSLGHLLGRGAPLWLLTATAALWFSCGVLLGAAAGLLALGSRWLCVVPLAVFVGLVFVGVKAESLAERWGREAASALGWFLEGQRPAVLVLLVAATAAALLALDHILLRRLYTRDALLRRREPRDRARHRCEEGEGGGHPSSRWSERLDPRTRALWCLVLGSEDPEGFVRRTRWAMLLGGSWLAVTHWHFAGSAEPAALGPGVVLTFVAVWLATLALLVGATAAPWATESASSSTTPVPEPLLEIFPVDPLERVWTELRAGALLITLALVLLAPFALFSPLPAGTVLWWLFVLWLVALLLLGLGLCRITPMLDPRRRAFSWWRMTAAVLVGLAVATGVIWGAVQLLDVEPADRAMTAFGGFLDAHPKLSLVAWAVAMAVIELLILRKSLRRHRERWFDAVW